ncbi:hypothetical protein GCM10010466_63680 [Planomonospora alba]|uniref:Uncharacterized protein n=1 Tax=Planomonospora alba TaxID=161354 RepID=A0ABP6P1B2_9ACTN
MAPSAFALCLRRGKHGSRATADADVGALAEVVASCTVKDY